jgi:hypothetical protein
MRRTPPSTPKINSHQDGSSESTIRPGPLKRVRSYAFDKSISPEATAANEIDMEKLLEAINEAANNNNLAIKEAADLQMRKFDELNTAVTAKLVRVNQSKSARQRHRLSSPPRE